MIGYFAAVLLATLASDVSSDASLTLEMQKESSRIRKEQGLEPQTLDEECCKIAQDWADYMAKHHYFNHGGGEQIIAVVYKDVPSAFRGWMSSSGHRYWVLSGADRCGWGAAQSSTGTWYWAGAFRSSKSKLEPVTTTYVPKRRFRFFGRRR
jgi:uncharacterized protein YkwD